MKVDVVIHPPFWGAGTYHKWPEEFGMRGVGLHQQYIRDKDIVFEMLGHYYKLEIEKAKKFQEEYPSFVVKPGKIKLYTYPISMCVELGITEEEQSRQKDAERRYREETKAKEEQEELRKRQMSLF